MQFLQVTAATAGILALSLVALSLPISFRRRKTGISLGNGDDVMLTRLVRAHGNFTEYVPINLIILAVLELARGPGGLVCAVAALLIAGRILHAWGILVGWLPPRALGTVLTMACLITGGVGLLLPFLRS
jgi:uncharacterized membrane protein YecN with MAPEG domain